MKLSIGLDDSSACARTLAPGLAALCLAAALAAAPARAAPLEAGEIQPALPGHGTAGTVGTEGSMCTGAVGPDGRPATSDTVQMLLRLQQDAPAQGMVSSRPPAAGTVGTQDGKGEGASPAERLKALKSSLFGADAEETRLLPPGPGKLVGGDEGVGAGAAGGVEGMGGSPHSNAGSGLDPTPTAAQASRASGNALLANPMVRFIRDNRATSIGASLALLAAVWFTTNYRSRSGRGRRERR